RRFDGGGGALVALGIEERRVVAQRVARLDDPDGRRVRVAARAPELEVRALLDVIERALAIELAEPPLHPLGERAQGRRAQERIVRLDVGVDGQHLDAVRAQEARQHRHRQIRRGRITSRRINQGDLHKRLQTSKRRSRWTRRRRSVAWNSVRAKHLVPNGVTLCNIALGFLAIVSAAEGKFEQGTLFLFFAALCDLFDGKLARMLDASSKFGMELDSLSDAISFGIAPAVLIYLSALRPLGAVGAGIAVLYTLCGALRLARFNVDQNDLAKVTFQGVPIPIAAGYIMSLVMVRASLPIWLIAGGVA